jgi:hypothetical protein
MPNTRSNANGKRILQILGIGEGIVTDEGIRNMISVPSMGPVVVGGGEALHVHP